LWTRIFAREVIAGFLFAPSAKNPAEKISGFRFFVLV
jgi:hypothetical protein